MTHPLAALPKDVPRFDGYTEVPEGDMVRLSDILAALEAATPPDLVEAAGPIAALIELAAERERRDHDESGPLYDFAESEVLTAARNALPALIALCQAQAAQIAGMTKERDELRDMLERAQHVVPDLYTKWHERAASTLKGPDHD